jgi:hypothetical protein
MQCLHFPQGQAAGLDATPPKMDGQYLDSELEIVRASRHRAALQDLVSCVIGMVSQF